MQKLAKYNTAISNNSQIKLLFTAILLIFVVFASVFAIILSESDLETGFTFPYLFPWIFLTAFVLLTPLVIRYYKGTFNLFDPIVFSIWTYFLPVYVLGGIIFAIGLNLPYFTAFIDDPEVNLPLTYIYFLMGVIGLFLGFQINFAKRIGALISKKLPKLDWDVDKIVLPALILLGIGIWFNLSAWISGVLGFQRVDQYDAFDNIQYVLSLLVIEGSLLLWLYIFRTKQRNFNFYAVLSILIIIIPLRTMIAGSRGSLFLNFLMIAMAYVFSGRKLNAKNSVVFGIILVSVIFIGMIYGTTFRNVKGTESKVSTEEYVDSAFKTIDVITSTNPTIVLSEALGNLGERLENVSALAVVVSNYEKLAPYEAAYGMENNIWTYTWTAFIPRFIWNDKPIVSDARAYSELYFNFGENSFPMTTVGDLLRNFGPVGIPLGMCFLGFCLRVLYAGLIENQPFSIWRTMAYFMLMTRVSHEGFYGTIMPEMLRTAILIAFSLLIIKFVLKGRS